MTGVGSAAGRSCLGSALRRAAPVLSAGVMVREGESCGPSCALRERLSGRSSVPLRLGGRGTAMAAAEVPLTEWEWAGRRITSTLSMVEGLQLASPADFLPGFFLPPKLAACIPPPAATTDTQGGSREMVFFRPRLVVPGIFGPTMEEVYLMISVSGGRRTPPKMLAGSLTTLAAAVEATAVVMVLLGMVEAWEDMLGWV